MDKDLAVITGELLDTLEIENSVKKVQDVFADYGFSPETTKSYKKYGIYNIADIICLVKIERLFDLGYINDEEKKSLIRDYKDYKILDNVIGVYEVDVLFGDSYAEVGLSKEDYYEMSAKREKLADRLNKYGII